MTDRKRLETYFRETLQVVGGWSKGREGWSWARLYCEPESDTRWLVVELRHSEGPQCTVRVPVKDKDLTPVVVDAAVSGLALVRGVPREEVERAISSDAAPVKRSQTFTCGICKTEQTTTAVDDIPPWPAGWSLTAGAGMTCIASACKSTAMEKAREAVSKMRSTPKKRPSKSDADRKRMDDHNARWGKGGL